MKTRRLTDRQLSALMRISRSAMKSEPIGRDVFRQLLRRGLVLDTMQVWEREEWGKVIARLPVAALTAAGEAAIEANTGRRRTT